MIVSSEVTYDGNPIRFFAWEYGYSPGSPFPEYQVTPLEPATEFAPSKKTDKKPVDIKLTVEGVEEILIENAWVDVTDDGVDGTGRVNQIGGRDEVYRLFERGPLRETIFVPRNILDEVYPRGVKIMTESGERVIGLPPETEPRITGAGFPSTKSVKRIGSVNDLGNQITIDPRTKSGSRSGPRLPVPTYDTHFETEYVTDDTLDDCTEDNRRGVVDVWEASVPPLIVLFGGKGLGSRLSRDTVFSGLGVSSTNKSHNSFSRSDGAPGSLSKQRAGGAGGASVNLLVRILAQRAGFTEVVINTPDMAVLEPVTVSAGASWVSVIETLVGPWNAEIFADGTTLYVLDIEAASLTNPQIILGPETASVIRKQTTRIPPYRALDIIGTLKRAVRRPNNTQTDVDRGDVTPSVPQISGVGIRCNQVISETYFPSDFGSGVPIFPGEDAINWTKLEVTKCYHIDPSGAQLTLVESEERLDDPGGLLSRRVMRIIQGELDDAPSGRIEEEYARLKAPGFLTQQPVELIRRVTTKFDDVTELEGVFAQHALVESLVVFSRQNGQNYKAIVYQDAAGAATIDLSAGSIDSVQFCKVQEQREEYQVIAARVGRKRTWQIDYLGGRPPRFHDEEFAIPPKVYGGGYSSYDPRQRFCGDINNVDGERVKAMAALMVSNREQAELIRGRVERRGNQRQESITVQVETYLPKLRKGMVVELQSTPIIVLNAANTGQSTVNAISGFYFIAGFRYRLEFDSEATGAVRITTILNLRGRWG